MNLYNYTQCSKVYILQNANFDNLSNLSRLILEKNVLLISFSPTEIHQKKPLLRQANKMLKEQNSFMVIIRSRYNNPMYFNETPITSSNCCTIQDYSIIQTKFGNFMCFGGHISYNREWLKKHESLINQFKTNSSNYKKMYYENETLEYHQDIMEEIINGDLPIKGVISYSPLKVEQPECELFSYHNQIWINHDKTLKEDINNLHNVLNQIYSQLIESKKITLWFNINNNNVDRRLLQDTKCLIWNLPFQPLSIEETTEYYTSISNVKPSFRHFSKIFNSFNGDELALEEEDTDSIIF